MRKRGRRPKQTSMWVATQDLPRSAAHPFYARLNQILDKADLDGYVEAREVSRAAQRHLLATLWSLIWHPERADDDLDAILVFSWHRPTYTHVAMHASSDWHS